MEVCMGKAVKCSRSKVHLLSFCQKLLWPFGRLFKHPFRIGLLNVFSFYGCSHLGVDWQNYWALTAAAKSRQNIVSNSRVLYYWKNQIPSISKKSLRNHRISLCLPYREGGCHHPCTLAQVLAKGALEFVPCWYVVETGTTERKKMEKEIDMILCSRIWIEYNKHHIRWSAELWSKFYRRIINVII